MNQQQPKVCPLSLRAPEKQSVVVPGQQGHGVTAAACVGPACMAFTPIADEKGQVVGGDCRLCMAPTLINGVVAMLNDLNHLVGLGLSNQGVELPKTDEKETH